MRVKKLSLFSLLLAAILFQYSIYVVDGVFADRAIKLLCMGGLLVFFKHHRISAEFRKILLLYGLLFAAAFSASVVVLDVGGIAQCFKIVWASLCLPLLLAIVPDASKPPDQLIRIPLKWALFFSIQSLILFALVYANCPPPSRFINLERYDNMVEWSYGIFGFANGMNSIHDGTQILRAQSWFLEPSKLAGFLIYPTLVSFGYYQSTKKLIYIFISILCAACIGITFSLAGFIGMVASMAALIVIRPAAHGGAKAGVGAYVKGAFAVFLLFVSARLILAKMTELYPQRDTSRITKVLARDSQSQQLLRGTSRLDLAQELLSTRGIGVGLGGTHDASQLTSPNAFIFWVIAGGVPAMIILILLYHRLLSYACLPLLQSVEPHYRMVAAGFIGYTVQQLSYGTWVEPLYLFTVGIMLLCAAHQRQSRLQTASA